MEWPAVYTQESKDEDLMHISFEDWEYDVDARFAIGPLNGETDHYLVDSESNVYLLSSSCMDDDGQPLFELEKVEKPAIVDLVKLRAKVQLDIVPNNFSMLVKELDY
jgi:hypothetical protein